MFFIWDVGTVLQYIKTQWYDNPLLTNADLTCKFATLLALTTALKAFLIQHLNTEFMAKYKDKNIFFFSKLQKSWSKDQSHSPITFFAFGEDKPLRVVETLNGYINHSKPLTSNHLIMKRKNI